MSLEEKTKKRIVEDRKIEITLVISPLTKEEAREMYPYRPYSKYSESRFGGDNLRDDIALLLNREAERCKMCRAPTRVKYLSEETCPDCDGRSESNGVNPRAIDNQQPPMAYVD